ncbi:MAG: zinc-dependent alcohol dehydrogenase family protein [Chloroflexi bacterium]|nr:zinc-dependent alcohol dehydrogenase family protein [Chloroflexota bacterium]
MQAVVVHRPGYVSVERVEDPTCADDGVVIRVSRCGICGTDQHVFAGDYGLAQYPLIPGHEVAGTVVEVGRAVQTIRPGQQVVVEPNIHCERCLPCRTRRGNHCLNLKVLGINEAGGFATFLQAPERNIYAADQLTPSQAAFVEPLACVVHGVCRLAPTPGSRILIAGAGPIGLLMLQTLLHSGAAIITVTDLHASRLALAQELGASQAVIATNDSDGELMDIAPLGYDAAVDCTGIPLVIERLVPRLAPGGKLLIFGVAPEEAAIRIRPYELFQRDLTLLGSFAVAYTFDAALALLESGAVRVDRLVSRSFGLQGFAQGLELMRKGIDVLKVQLDPALDHDQLTSS